MNLITQFFSSLFASKPGTALTIPEAKVTFIGTSENEDRVNLFIKGGHKALFRTREACAKRYRGEGGWEWSDHGDGIVSHIYEDDTMPDVTSICVNVGKVPTFELKYKHQQMWIAGRGIPMYEPVHPRAQTFGVLGWTPIESFNDLARLPPEISHAIKVLGQLYGKVL